VTLSKSVRPLVLRTVDGKPVVPSWLRHGAHKVQPAPFMPAQPEPSEEDLEPEPHPSPSLTMRRSSLPPRMSVPPAPPPVRITRPPPAPAAPAPVITPAEQEAYAHAALELASLRARVMSNAEAQLLELAVAVAESIIEREIERNPALHVALARAAIAALGDTRSAKLRVSRTAFKAITQVHGEEALDVDGVRVELMLDNSLEGLSVIAEAGASRVDGRVAERLAAVLRAIEAEHRRSGSAEDA
jgi:hypothetical protein